MGRASDPCTRVAAIRFQDWRNSNVIVEASFGQQQFFKHIQESLANVVCTALPDESAARRMHVCRSRQYFGGNFFIL